MQPIPTMRVGIVGGGLGALTAYIVLRFRGIPREEIAVFAPLHSPEQSWQQFVEAINQKFLRSESIGHLYPTDSPGLATMEAIRRRSLIPIFQAWFDRFHPTVTAFIEHARNLAQQTGFHQSLVNTTISHLERRSNDVVLYGNQHEVVGVAQHVILAVGHGPSRVPTAVQNYRQQCKDDRVVTAFEKKTYQPETVLVIGSGITAATEWVNILTNGGAVAAISQDGFTMNQPLQVPRQYFSRRGLQPYAEQSDPERLQELRDATRGTIPAYPIWRKLFAQAQAEGRLGLATGTVEHLEPTADGRVQCHVTLAGKTEVVVVDRVIAATGFAAPRFNPLLNHLITYYNIPTIEDVIRLDDTCCIPQLSTSNSIVAVVGPAAAWSIPCADSLTGMKIAARTIAQHIVGPEKISLSDLVQQTKNWATLVFGKHLV